MNPGPLCREPGGGGPEPGESPEMPRFRPSAKYRLGMTVPSGASGRDADQDADVQHDDRDAAPGPDRIPGEAIRVVVAKPGLDGHDRGAKVVARALRDAGVEVIYTGLHQTPEQIVEAAIQEDAQGIGLSVLSGAHMTLFQRLMRLLSERGVDDIVVFGGGIVPEEDIAELKALGVAEVFGPGTPTPAIVAWVRDNLRAAATQ